MEKQYFSVGEEVILDSNIYPQLNGEYIIDSIVESGDTFTCRVTGHLLTVNTLVYILDTPLLIDDGPELFASQPSLRKKYKGGESFSKIMEDINNTIEA